MGEGNNSKLMFVGIQTKEEYIDTRAKTAIDTWINSIHGDSKFFVGENVNFKPNLKESNIPVVRLPDVKDNSYPRQRKSFYM